MEVLFNKRLKNISHLQQIFLVKFKTIAINYCLVLIIEL